MVLQQIKAEIQRRKKVISDACGGVIVSNSNHVEYKTLCELEEYINTNFDETCEKVPMATMDEDAKQFAGEYSFNIESDLYQTLTDEQRVLWKKEIENAIKVGVSWQTERFENNRVNAFKNQTEEEAQIEMDFAVSIIEKEHRTPTFDDAIKYGMRLQQMKNNQDESDMALIAALDGAERGKKAMKAELMKNAIDGHIINNDGTHKLICPYLPIITRDMEEGDRVKVIVLKEEQQ